MHRSFLLGALGLALAAPAAGQSVLQPYGLLVDRGLGFTATIALPDNASMLGVAGGIARPQYDASAGLSHTSYDGDGDGGFNALTLGGSYYALREAAPTAAAPNALPVTIRVGGELAFGAASDLPDDYSQTAVGLVAGAGLSKRLALSPTLTFVPEVFGGLAYTRVTTEIDGESDSASDTEAAFALTGHFLFGTGTTRFAVTPALTYGGEEFTPSIQLSLLLPR